MQNKPLIQVMAGEILVLGSWEDFYQEIFPRKVRRETKQLLSEADALWKECLEGASPDDHQRITTKMTQLASALRILIKNYGDQMRARHVAYLEQFLVEVFDRLNQEARQPSSIF